MRRLALALTAGVLACVAPPTDPGSGAVRPATMDAAGTVTLVEFVDAARLSGPTVESPHKGARVLAYRQARPGESGASFVRLPYGDQFWAVLHEAVEADETGAFALTGLNPGDLYVVMLAEEPKRGGCVGLAGMARYLRVNPGVPVAPIRLAY